MSRILETAGTILVAAGLLLAARDAPAATVLTVGAGCQYTDLQAAIDNVGTTGTFEFHVRANYVGAPISYSNKSIWIFGGYATCNDAAPIPFNGQNLDALSTIDGSRSPGHPGIQVSGPSRLVLHNFQIHNATNPHGNGGGISYNGSGARASLALQSVNINHNSAERGGGVFFRSTVSGTEHVMSIGDYTWIEFNTGTISGGGIRLEGNVALTANGNPASISNNMANPNSSDGAGGGLQLRDDTVANIGSPGWAGFAFVDHNHARLGGGVAVQNNARLNLYSSAPGQLARIETNDAPYGGGVYVEPAGGSPTVCMAGGGIDANDSSADGPAIYIVGGGTSHVSASESDRACDGNGLPGFVACAQGQPCNTIDRNRGARVSASVISAENGANVYFGLRYASLRNNFGARLLWTESGQTQSLETCTIAGNDVGQNMIINVGGTLQLVGCSIGGNHLLPGMGLFDGSGPLQLIDTIAYEPGYTTFRRGTANVTLRNVIAADAGIYAPGNFALLFNVSAADPLFTGTSVGDLQLQPNSPAIDAAATGTTMDLNLMPRGIDVAQGASSPNLGPYDLGAYEVQHLDPQVPVTFPPDETFDELGPIGALPPNWQIVPAVGGDAWTLTSDSPDSGDLAAYVADATHAMDSTLTTPPFHIVGNGRLTFRHRVSLEFSGRDPGVAFDAAVLEIRIGSESAFHDVIDSGGRFVTGGYDHVVAVGASFLAGRRAWSGEHPDYGSVVVELPAAADGQDVQLRWRVATDADFGRRGYWVDSIHVDVDGSANDRIFADAFEANHRRPD